MAKEMIYKKKKQTEIEYTLRKRHLHCVDQIQAPCTPLDFRPRVFSALSSLSGTLKAGFH